MVSVRFQSKPFNITVIQVYAPTSNAEEAEVEQFYDDLQDLLELIPQEDILFMIGDWNVVLRCNLKNDRMISVCEKKRSEKQRRKGKIFPFECRVPKNSKER